MASAAIAKSTTNQGINDGSAMLLIVAFACLLAAALLII